MPRSHLTVRTVTGLFLVATLTVLLPLGLGSEPAAGQGLKPFTFILDFPPGPEHVQYFVALDKGWYAEEGLDVTILRGVSGIDTVKRIVVGQGNAGVADFSSIVAARANDDAPAKAILLFYRRSPHAIFVLGDSDIYEAKDLVGKSLAITPGNAHQILFPLFAHLADFPDDSVTWVTMDAASMGPALLFGRVDGAPLMVHHEARLQKQAAELGKTLRRFSYAEQGMNIYSSVVFASEAEIAQNADTLRAFLRATVRAIEYVARDGHFQEAARITQKYNPEVDVEAVAGGAEVAARYSLTEEVLDGRVAIGQFEADWVKNSRDVYTEYLRLRQVVPVEDLYTNELLPAVK